jgi:hypothetical protein
MLVRGVVSGFLAGAHADDQASHMSTVGNNRSPGTGCCDEALTLAA